jgi:hypothetical protein
MAGCCLIPRFAMLSFGTPRAAPLHLIPESHRSFCDFVDKEFHHLRGAFGVFVV